MTTHLPATVLLIEKASSPEERLRQALQKAGVHFLTVSPESVSIEQALADEQPDLLLAGCGVSREVLEHLDSKALEDGPNTLVLTSATGMACRDNSRIDYLDANSGDEALIARLHWHLRLRGLEKERERLREELENLRRNASIGSVADSVTHNLNNVLGIVFGYMHLLKMHHEKPEMVLKHHASLEKAIAKITEMVRRFGEAARETQPEPEPVPVTELLRCAIRRFRQENRVENEYPFTVKPEDLMVTTCFSRAEDAIAGLLKNAWESYGDAPVSGRAIEISASADAENIIIMIRDHGTGIDPEIEPTMFEPFTGTKGGDGLGLAVARRCFRNLGGDLFLKNHRKTGAVAEIRHPR